MDSFSAYSAGVASAAASAAGLCGHVLNGDRSASASDNSISNELCEQANGADCVVVCGDAEINVIGIAVGVERANNGDVEAVGLVDSDLLTVGVDDEDHVRGLLHVTDTVEVGLQLSEFLLQKDLLLLGQKLHTAVSFHSLELFHALNARADGGEVGEHTTEPTSVLRKAYRSG